MPRYALAVVRRAAVLASTCMWLTCGTPAFAASFSSRDVQIIAKALGFLDPAPPGGTVAVIYARGNAVSKSDANAIVALFGDGLPSGGGNIKAKAVDDVSFGNGASYVAVILAAGAEQTAASITTRPGLLTITAADSLVQAGRCVMAVHSDPKVDITVNRAAAQAAGVGFTAAFGMLVHEI